MGQRQLKLARREARIQTIMDVHKVTRAEAIARLTIHKRTVSLGKSLGKPKRSEVQRPVAAIDRFKKPGEEEEDEQDGEE